MVVNSQAPVVDLWRQAQLWPPIEPVNRQNSPPSRPAECSQLSTLPGLTPPGAAPLHAPAAPAGARAAARNGKPRAVSDQRVAARSGRPRAFIAQRCGPKRQATAEAITARAPNKNCRSRTTPHPPKSADSLKISFLHGLLPGSSRTLAGYAHEN